MHAGLKRLGLWAVSVMVLACGGAPDMEGAPVTSVEQSVEQPVAGPRTDRELARLQRQVERLTEGLLFLSESDARFIFVGDANARVTDVTPEAVVTFLSDEHDGRTDLFVPNNPPLAPLAGRPFEVLDADAFFARIIGNLDPADPASRETGRRLRQLQRLLERELEDLTVIRFGEPGRTDVSGQVSIFIVGRTREGALAGVLTGAIET
ncbi:MAG TPA: nuclease A inhibitor family protein [Archangium sp.]|nr:nuclease A inhibitor family protein [Archangium sp.]